MTESIWVTPDMQSSSAFFQSTGETRNYGAGSPANGSTLSASDEDGVAYDCLLWNNAGKANPAFSHNESYPSATQGQVHFWGSSANPLEDPRATIDWDVTTTISTTTPTAPTASLSYSHTCYPAHRVTVNGSVIYSYQPGANTTDYIFQCLVTKFPTISGTVGPIGVPAQ